MKFFYADSLDQTSMVYDLINEEYPQNTANPLAKRNPYKDDCYFHEIFHSVRIQDGTYHPTTSGYHGLLLSLHSYHTNYGNTSLTSLPAIFRFPPQKSSLTSKELFDTSKKVTSFRSLRKKKKKAKIHKNLPIMADSGAFHYRDQKDPPYHTVDVVKTYRRFQCTYAVALDHIPNHAKIAEEQARYYRRIEDFQKKTRKVQKEIDVMSQQLPLFDTPLDSNHKKLANLEKQKKQYQDLLLSIEKEHPVKIKRYEEERDYRWNLSMRNAAEFLVEHKKQNAAFIPVGTAHGWDAESYRQSTTELKKMGYQYIAIGGLVPIASDQKKVRHFVEVVSNSINGEIPLHLFGIKSIKPKEIQHYQSLNVQSFDSSSPITQSMKDSRSNYWADNKNYINLRIPRVGYSPTIDKRIKEGHISREEAERQEALCLGLVRALDSESPPDAYDILAALEDYAKMYKKPFTQSKRELTLETLHDKPWKSCPCKICRQFGVEVMIFRGSVRNKARGFHNIWKLGQWVRQGVK